MPLFQKSSLALCIFSALVSCSTFSLFRPSDCQTTAEEYGRCYADLGYNPAGFHALVGFCAKHGSNLDESAFAKVRSSRIAERCGEIEGAFTLAFRTRAHFNGQEFCAKTLLNSEALRKASSDGEEAGYAFHLAQTHDGQIAEAEKRRRAADKNGFGTGLEDRLLRSSPDDEAQARDKARLKYRQILAQYPRLTEPALTLRLKCTPDGLF